MAPLIDPENLAELRDLAGPDDPDFLKNYLGTVLDAIPGHMDGMRKAMASGDPKALAHEAHALKSSFANTGIETMRAVSASLEALGKGGSVEGAQPLFDELARLCEQLKAEIKALPELASG